MVNAKAYVPSDILIASNGKSIEVLNTDAEGRLTLADALVYADIELGCEKIIELSTLTGACIVALGTNLSGVFTKYDDLTEELATASKVTNDQSWRLPMHDEYNKLLESKIADIKNIGTRPGSSIQAALFLQNFVSEDKPFAHIDIAQVVEMENEGIIDILQETCKIRHFVPGNKWVQKVLQLKQVMEMRHGVMLVGPVGSGKSSALSILQTVI